MTMGVVRSLKVRRCLEGGVMNSKGERRGERGSVLRQQSVIIVRDGDNFNMSRFPLERSRGSKLSLAMRRFSEDKKKSDDPLSLEEEESRKEARENYKKPNLSELSFERLEDFEVIGLEKPFIEKEVFEVLLGFSGDKALGPNGFSMVFWQFSWNS
ncbi:hypothetical protein CK203_051466 [Vitis vinifera]|uniref:Uncharacterized protein n=1 Tax=Vitis vinifera TaxID=29760 RepID=A0A438H259_VITVI|nr:hypothetical protein CK203_051466 [Vitis vinifera]